MCFQKWHEELGELSLQSEKLYIDGLFLSKAYNVSARKFQKDYVPWNWRVMQNLKENCLVAWKKSRYLVNFNASSRKSENLHFDWILLSKACKDSDEKIQKSYVSWYWRVMQSLKKNWSLVPKKPWGIWWILTQTLKGPKISLRWAIFVQRICGLS